ncbi:MAG: hypothetical protein R2867_31915 [Caldilineaceae bacterium]
MLRALQAQKQTYAFFAEFKEFDYRQVTAARQFTQGVSAEQKLIQQEGLKAARIGLAVHLVVIALEFAWTLATHHIPLDSVEFNHLIAETIAKVLWAVIQFALSINPYTALFFAVIHVIDAILAVACTIHKDAQGGTSSGGEFFEKYICPGITGYIIKGITFVLNDTTLLMDLEKDNQFDVVFDPPTITTTDNASGIAVGNTLTLSATITANAYTGHPNWMGYIWN